MSNIGAEQIIAESNLSAEIFEAREDGDHKILASLLGQLVERNTNHEHLRILEIQALQRSCDRSDADVKAIAGMHLFPDSIHFAFNYACNALFAKHWSEAIMRFRSLRSAFDPKIHFSSAETLLFEFHCTCEMMNEVEARNLLAHYLDVILSYDAVAFSHHKGMLIEIINLIPSKRAPEYFDWLTNALSQTELEAFTTATALRRETTQWVTLNVPDIEIVSLGQNCLPWSLPNALGLRPNGLSYEPFGPLDLLGLGGDIVAECLETNFALLLDSSQFIETVTAHKHPLLYSRSYQAGFWHEIGSWWAENEWARLLAAYEARIDRFRKGVRNAKRLYVYCLCSEVNLGRLIDAYKNFLDDQNARLLIINVLSEKIEIEIQSTKVEICHIAYPEDYVWWEFSNRYTTRGQAFESEIAQTIIHALGKMSQV